MTPENKERVKDLIVNMVDEHLGIDVVQRKAAALLYDLKMGEGISGVFAFIEELNAHCEDLLGRHSNHSEVFKRATAACLVAITYLSEIISEQPSAA